MNQAACASLWSHAILAFPREQIYIHLGGYPLRMLSHGWRADL